MIIDKLTWSTTDPVNCPIQEVILTYSGNSTQVPNNQDSCIKVDATLNVRNNGTFCDETYTVTMVAPGLANVTSAPF